MESGGFKRKLAAILSADVVGYSRLMRDDEEATVRTLNKYKELIFDLIDRNQGRLVDSTGDNLLAEFASVVDAVRCAVQIQEDMKTKNEESPDNRKMEFRIGINTGDVIQEGDRLYGDGVNVAARLESLADAGGICISRTAYDQVKRKLNLRYDYLGEHEVKNIDEPVRVYKVLMKNGLEEGPGKERSGALASENKMAFSLPDKPSIAVLPFVNMSGDPKQEYFCDGMTEEIITALSKLPRLFVIARNSSFTYKGKSVKVQKVSEDLGVKYVLEGSLKKAGNRIRITAQLIDAVSGNHLWAERYDRELKDIFAVQDEITFKVVEAMGLKITKGPLAGFISKGTNNLEAYLKVMEGTYYMMLLNPDDRILAKNLFEEAIKLDPDYAGPYGYLGICNGLDVMQGTAKNPKESLMEAHKLARKGLKIDETHMAPNYLLAFVQFLAGRYDIAIQAFERALEINPNHTPCLTTLGMSLNAIGKPLEAIRLLNRALRLDPLDPYMAIRALGLVNASTESYEEAVKYLKKALELNPKDMTVLAYLAFCYVSLERDEDARAVAAEILKLHPRYSVKKDLERQPLNQMAKERMQAALLKAGLTE